jgi:integrase
MLATAPTVPSRARENHAPNPIPTSLRLDETAKPPYCQRLPLKEATFDTKYIVTTITYINSIIAKARFNNVNDIRADAVNTYASELRRNRSARTVQAHLTAIKGFTRWLAAHNKVSCDPLAAVKRPSLKGQREHERRALLPEEWRWLGTTTVAENVNRCGMESRERALLYCTAIQTGLRSSELRSLTRGKLYLEAEPPFVTCTAGSTKNRRDCRQYIKAELAADLKAHIATKMPTAPVSSMPSKCDVAGMLRADIEAARRAWLKAAEHDSEERLRREQSDFLEVANHEGEQLDFHALWHTCGAWLAMSGAHPKSVQAVMRHSTITLTMGTYGHLFPGQEAETVARFPEMLTNSPDGVQAAGAYAVASSGGRGCGQHFGQQLNGGSWRNVAPGGERTPHRESGSAPALSKPQVVGMAKNKKSRRVMATAGLEAEGTGVEPATGCPAPDFESGRSPFAYPPPVSL